MLPIKNSAPRSHKLAIGSLMLICLVIPGSTSALSEDRSKPETLVRVQRRR
jgi:hypothetical protein